MRRTLLTIGLMLAATPVFAKMQAKPVEWKVGNEHFSGYVVYDDAGKAKRPGLVMVPDWYGVSDSAVEKAKHIAGTDYVVLLTDVYGKGLRPKSNEEALAQVKKLNADETVWRARINKAVDVLKAQAGSAPLEQGGVDGVAEVAQRRRHRRRRHLPRRAKYADAGQAGCDQGQHSGAQWRR